MGGAESESCSVVSNSLWPPGLYSPWKSPSQNTGVGSLSILQGIFPIQGSNPGLLYYRRILYQLSHKRSPWQHYTEHISLNTTTHILITLHSQSFFYAEVTLLALSSPSLTLPPPLARTSFFLLFGETVIGQHSLWLSLVNSGSCRGIPLVFVCGLVARLVQLFATPWTVAC